METKVVELNLNDVLPNRFQPRIKFSEESIQALAESIKVHGVIQPIVVRNIGDKYEIIAGERRYKASVLAGKQTIPAIITDLNEKDSAEVAIIENVQRKDLTPIEEAISYKKILDMGYLTQDSLALKLGKTQSTIANKLRLLNLDDDVQEALLNEKISERHARSLLRITSHEKQRIMLNRIINERLTVRKTDEEIDKMMDNNGNNEFLNFGAPTPTAPINNDVNVFNNMNNVNTGLNNQTSNNEPVEFLDIFGTSNTPLNIPTEPIAGDSIPEVLPSTPEVETKPFVPEPVVFEPIIPAEPKVETPVQEPINDSIFATNNVVEPTMPINNDVNFFNTNVNDIYKEQPLAPMDNLLQPSNGFVAMDNINNNVAPETDDDSDGEENLLVPGKFFNLMPEEDEVEKPEVKPLTSDFNFDFDINSLNNIESTSNLNTTPTLDNNVEQSNMENPFPSFDSFFNFNNLEPTPQPKAIEPVLENVNTQDSVVPEVNTLEEPFKQNVEIPSIPEVNFDIPVVDPVQPNTLNENMNIESNVSVPNESLQETTNSNDVNTAIKMIKDLSEQLSKMGYTVNLDEFDFENMYQVIFKINK